jgi:OFA family oxalate/formate antiporter-like MFS transporter
VLVIGAAMFIKNPPEGYKPEGWEPDTTERSDRSGRDFEFGQAVRTWQWFALWSLLFLNVTAGIAVISEASPMAEEIAGASATAAAGLVALIAIFNGFGRFAWAAASDVIGRRWVFLTMFVIQIGLFVLLPNASSYVFFAVLACAILLCYGGGFGTMPAFAADYFGSKNVGRIYGLMLSAWSAGGVAGPLLISKIRDSTGNYDTALYIIAGMLAAACIIPLIVRPPGPDRAEGEAAEGAGRFTRKDEAVSGDRETARSGA